MGPHELGARGQPRHGSLDASAARVGRSGQCDDFFRQRVVDWKNSSGFGKDGRPPLVAVYTGFRTTDRVQFQCIAYRNDKGRTWTKYSGNPVIDINSMDFVIPRCNGTMRPAVGS